MGFGGGSVPPPPPPPAPLPPPPDPFKQREIAERLQKSKAAQRKARGRSANILNEGGGQGLLEEPKTSKALLRGS